jgi:hypothetical protein
VHPPDSRHGRRVALDDYAADTHPQLVARLVGELRELLALDLDESDYALAVAELGMEVDPPAPYSPSGWLTLVAERLAVPRADYGPSAKVQRRYLGRTVKGDVDGRDRRPRHRNGSRRQYGCPTPSTDQDPWIIPSPLRARTSAAARGRVDRGWCPGVRAHDLGRVCGTVGHGNGLGHPERSPMGVRGQPRRTGSREGRRPASRARVDPSSRAVTVVGRRPGCGSRPQVRMRLGQGVNTVWLKIPSSGKTGELTHPP